jgi:hypothetical protein
MTTNSFIFSWHCNGVEAIIPISQYEKIDKENTIRILKGEPKLRNPLDNIIRNLILRASFNSQRNYEIYAVDCDTSMDADFWTQQWANSPKFTADLIREKGHKIYSGHSTE